MSKIDQGPAASSFESPSKVGWLYKHGGSGVSSHWRKRWFVADHHYLFYYKGPNDKKPVGIVCLPDYESCHKAEIKIWKKQHSFMLDRGNTGQENDSSEGTPAKNYVLYADSEDEMQEWIKALSEEIKPMIGEDRYANGFSGGGGGGGGKTSSSGSNSTSSSSGGSSKGKGKKGKGGGGGEPGVDDKALDKVTALAGEGPKLTHLTASRPKVPRGRRPPKRYAVFHEDDSRPEESPPATPDLSKPSDPSPTSSPSPSDSPAPKKKGHKPMVALLPSRAASVKVSPKTPPIPPAKVAKVEPESPRETTQKLKFARPTPPKKPLKEKPPPTATIKEEVPPEAVPSPEPPSEAPLHTPTTPTSHRPPTPPTKPSKEKEPTATTPTPFEKKTENVQQQQQSRGEDDQQTKGAPRPSPVRRQRPQPPVKPRTNTMAATGSAAVSGGSGEGGGTAAPPMATQIAESAVPQPSQQQQQRPVPAKRPVPRKRVVTPQQSPSREAVPTVAAAASAAVTKETAALPKEVQDQVKKEPPVPAKEMKPQPATKEVVVSEKEEKAEAEVKTVTTAKVEEPIVPEKEIKPLPTKEPDILKKEVESAAIKEAVIPEKEAKPETPVVAVEKEEKLLVEGKVEQAAVGLERAVEKSKEKEEKLPPTPFDDVEETDTKISESEKVNIIQEGQKQRGEGESGKIDTDNVKQQDESMYVYEDMEPGSGEKGDNNIPQDEKPRTDSEYEIMNFDEEEKAGEKESAVVTTTEEVARQQQQQQQGQAPGKVHQYDQVALDEAEPRFKISSSSSKDFDGTLSSSSGYEHMDPAPAAVRTGDKEREPSVDGEYVPMKDGVIIDQEPGGEREGGEKGVATADQTSTDKYEYEEPCEWVEQIPPKIRDASPPYDSLSATRLTPSPGHNRRPDELAPDADVRRSVASSSGSVSSQKSLQTSSLEVKGGVGVVSSGEERRRGSSGASRKSSEAGSVQLQPERDSFGYAKVNKIRQPGAKDERVNSVTSELDRGSSPVPPEIIPMAVPMEEESPQHISPSPSPSYKTVPETLRQAKEVLRLAQVVKAEAEQMREEARRELNIAKKDRHEATLLKKNAAEILRMAKARLNSVGAK